MLTHNNITTNIAGQKCTYLLYHSFSKKSGEGLTGSSAGLQLRCRPGLGSHLASSHGGWQNLVPRGHQAEVFFLLGGSWYFNVLPSL